MNRVAFLMISFLASQLWVSRSAKTQELGYGEGTDLVAFLERSYVFFSIPTSGLTFEAQIAPQLVIWQNLARRSEVVLTRSRPRVWAWSVSATPMVRLRMFNEPSNPVRTPSYMPKLNFQVFSMKNLVHSDDELEHNRGPVGMWVMQGMIGHHSNGQDGCLFNEQIQVDDECTTPSIPSGTRTVNKETGSFSTNYLNAGVFYKRMHLQNNETRMSWAAGTSLEVHPSGFLRAGAIEEELEELYGTTRVSALSEVAWREAWRCAKLRLGGAVQYIHDPAPEVRKIAVSAEGACVLGPLAGTRWGFFVRYYSGQDYYNLGFLDNISRLHAGVTFDQERFTSFLPDPTF